MWNLPCLVTICDINCRLPLAWVSRCYLPKSNNLCPALLSSSLRQWFLCSSSSFARLMFSSSFFNLSKLTQIRGPICEVLEPLRVFSLSWFLVLRASVGIGSRFLGIGPFRQTIPGLASVGLQCLVEFFRSLPSPAVSSQHRTFFVALARGISGAISTEISFSPFSWG